MSGATRQVRRYDLSTGAIETAFELDGGLYSIVHAAELDYALATSDSETSVAVGDDLVIRTFESDLSSRLLVQPLP